MKKINENTKVTLTLGQLKRLVKESKKLTVEHEEVSVVTPSGEHLGMLDDEGNFLAGEYPSDRFDCGEIVDDDGEYARMCGCFTKEYGYKDAKPKVEPKVDVFPMDKMFYGKMPKDEGQAIYYLYQIVCIAQGKKKSPIAKGNTPEVVKTLRGVQDSLGITEPEVTPSMLDPDEVSDHHVEKFPDDEGESWLKARIDDAINTAIKGWELGIFDQGYGTRVIETDFARACAESLSYLYGIDLRQLKKLLLDYYRTDKASRSTSEIVSCLQSALNNNKFDCIVKMAKKNWDITWD